MQRHINQRINGRRHSNQRINGRRHINHRNNGRKRKIENKRRGCLCLGSFGVGLDWFGGGLGWFFCGLWWFDVFWGVGWRVSMDRFLLIIKHAHMDIK